MMTGWKNLSITTKLTLIVGVMGFLIAGELLVLTFSMDALSAVRAFVGGEGLWSKAQKNATFSLQHYALTHDERDYEDFRNYLKIPEGDHMARAELMKPHPDLEKVRQGFLQGHLHPDDIAPVIRLLERFYWVSYMDRAISYWIRGDRLLEELSEAGKQYREAMLQQPPNQKLMAKIASRIRTINEKVSVVEEGFSEALGEGSRWLEHVVLTLLLLAVLTVETIGLTLTYRVTRRISQGLSALNEAADRMGRGRFDHKLRVDRHDEIGNLTDSINQMGTLLERSYRTLEARVEERTRELSRLAEENARLYEETKTALNSREEFLSIASHELKTPLSSLSLQLQLLKKQLSSQPPSDLASQQQAGLDRSFRQVQRLTALIDDLLDLTRIRSGKFELTRKDCDLTTLVRDSVVGLEYAITNSKSKVRVHADQPVLGNWDPARMSQVITNLISNAIKYGKGNPIDIFVAQNSAKAEIVVQDEGIGIPSEKLDLIFDRFERVSEKTAIAGLGLGLYITRQIVQAHNGEIRVQSEPEKGSRFTVHLPRSV